MRVFIGLFFGLFTCSVWATDYYWKMSGGTGASGATAFDACAAVAASYGATFKSVSLVDVGAANCYTTAGYSRLVRYGDSCPTGTTYDATIVDGSTQCISDTPSDPEESDPDNSDDQSSDCSSTQNITITGGTYTSKSPTGDSQVYYNGCIYNVDESTGICTSDDGGENYTCGYNSATGTGTGTGDTSQTGTGVPADDDSGSTGSDDGNDTGTGSGTDDGTGSGTGDSTGDGTGTGDSSDDSTGTGSSDGEDDGTGTGTSTGTGSGTDDGETDGTCDPATDPNGCVEKSVSGGDCSATFQCSGDVIQCEATRQEKELRCYVEKQGDFESNKTDIQSLVSGSDFQQQDDETVEVPDFLSENTRFLSPGCPDDVSLDLTANGGHSFAFSYKPLCSVAEDFSYLIVAIAAVFAAIFVGRAFGGS